MIPSKNMEDSSGQTKVIQASTLTQKAVTVLSNSEKETYTWNLISPSSVIMLRWEGE